MSFTNMSLFPGPNGALANFGPQTQHSSSSSSFPQQGGSNGNNLSLMFGAPPSAFPQNHAQQQFIDGSQLSSNSPHGLLDPDSAEGLNIYNSLQNPHPHQMMRAHNEPRPKDFYKKRLEEIAETLEKKFKQASPNEIEFVHSQEAQELFANGVFLFNEILNYSVNINSDTFRAWVLIQRWSGRMQNPDVLYDQIKTLGIHRPSFRLCASILTSYANGSYQLKKPEYVDWAIMSLNKMKEHNYVPNTYVYNALFVMCNKNQLYSDVWKFFIELMLNTEPGQSPSNNLDGFTCASLMETCVAEQNPQKGLAIFEMFRQLPTTLKKNNEKYILQLKTKLDDIYQEQSRDFDFQTLRQKWQDMKPLLEEIRESHSPSMPSYVDEDNQSQVSSSDVFFGNEVPDMIGDHEFDDQYLLMGHATHHLLQQQSQQMNNNGENSAHVASDSENDNHGNHYEEENDGTMHSRFSNYASPSPPPFSYQDNRMMNGASHLTSGPSGPQNPMMPKTSLAPPHVHPSNFGSAMTNNNNGSARYDLNHYNNNQSMNVTGRPGSLSM